MTSISVPVSGSVAPAQPRLRITRRGRAVLAVAVAVPLAMVAWWGLGSVEGAIATDAASSVEFDYVQVEAGQSLWHIASAIAPTADPREVVSDIERLNGLPTSEVFPGQRLAVPTQYAADRS